MDKATQPRPAGPGRRPGRGAKRDWVTREVTIRAEVPAGSRFKGYKERIVRRDLVIVAEVVRYKRERWLTPQGQTIIAPLPEGIAGGLRTRRAAVLPRPAHARPGDHRAPDRSVERHRPVDLEARGGAPAHHRILSHSRRKTTRSWKRLASSPYITVDDNGVRHGRRPGVTTQIGGDRFCVFRTSRSKSRLNFLSLLRAGCEDYVVNEATLDYLRRQPVEAAVIARLTTLQGQVFHSQMDWLEHQARCSINIFDRPLLQMLNEAATWGAIRHHGLMETTVVSRRCWPVPHCPARAVLGSRRAAPAEADAGLAQAGQSSGVGQSDDLVLLSQSEAVEAKPLTGR